MIYVEQGLEMLRTCMTELGLEYEVGKAESAFVEIAVQVADQSVTVWFDTKKQLFGFNLIAGGIKSYQTIEEFKRFFGTYVRVYTTLIPKAKIIADAFERVIDASTVFDKFVGKQDKGYNVLFRVLGRDNEQVSVCNDGTYWLAKQGELNDTKTSLRLIREYQYEFNKDNKLVLVPNIYSWADRIYEEYGESSTVLINRIGTDNFMITVEDLRMNVQVKFSYVNVIYDVLEINDIPCNLAVDYLQNVYSIEDLYMECKNWWDSHNISEEIEPEELEEPDISATQEDEPEDEQDLDIPDDNIEGETSALDKDQGNTEEDMNILDDSPKDQEEVKSMTEAEKETDRVMTAVAGETLVKLVVYEDKPQYLQFTQSGVFFNMSLKVAEGYGIPIDFITNRVNQIHSHGLLMTEDERVARKFAKDISDTEELCESLVSALFD